MAKQTKPAAQDSALSTQDSPPDPLAAVIDAPEQATGEAPVPRDPPPPAAATPREVDKARAYVAKCKKRYDQVAAGVLKLASLYKKHAAEIEEELKRRLQEDLGDMDALRKEKREAAEALREAEELERQAMAAAKN